ncbi:MAG: NAD(+) diphosphatase [Pseudomonadota bacterium]
MSSANPFAGAPLDRRAEARLRDDWLAEALADPETRFIVMLESAALVHPAEADALARAVFLSRDDARVTAHLDPQRLVLLGWFSGHRCVLVDVDAAAASTFPGETFSELRPLASELAAPEAALLGYARALNIWRANHRFCGRCGAPTVPTRAGHARLCTSCDNETFPRIDPAIIVLVHDGQQALLGRQANWPPNRYSTIAGFVEPGETLEEAVRREVDEETGIHTSTIDYHSSQPWPFPSSLMLGFQARGEYAVPTLRDGELEDARWFTSAQLRAGAVLLPPRETISRRLIDAWLDSVA